MISHKHRKLFAAGTLLLICACSAPISEEKFSLVQSDMSYEQVVSILGNPKDVSSISLGPLGGLGGLKSAEAVWERDDVKIVVRFVNGKVTVKTWVE